MNKQRRFIEFGTRLQKYRSLKNESITDVANAVEIDRSHLSKLENGHERPSLDVLNRLVSHFSLSRVEATELSNLAGFGGESQVVIETGRKEDVHMDQHQIPTGEEAKKQLEVRMPNNAVVLYTDSVFISSNQYGLVLDFAQSMGPTNQQSVVSRIGMSKEHAKIMLDVLKKHLEKTENQPK